MAPYSRPGSTHQVLGKSFVWLFACYLLFGCTATLNISTDEKHIIVDDDDDDHNWWEARYHCNETFGGDLFVPVTEPVPEDLFWSLDWNRHYWLGAMRYSTWIWTADNTPLYKYTGYILLRQEEDGKNISGNSVSSCHRECKDKLHFGLSGHMCYCLEENYRADDARKQGMPCPGNLDEVCGDAHGMSLYKLDLVFTPTQNGKPNGKCCYAKRKDKLTISLYNANSCDGEDRRYACYNNSISSDRSDYKCNKTICVSKYNLEGTWAEGNDICTLVKLESSAEDFLKTVMLRGKEYWIGLVYGSTKKWITGKATNVHDGHLSLTSSSEPHCVTVSNMISYLHLSWEPCSSQHASICEVVRSKAPRTTVTSTQPHTSSSPTTATTTSETETPTQQPPTANVPVSERYMSTSTSSLAVGSTESFTASEETQTSVFVGLGLGCVVLILAAIIVVLLVMRQNKLCFKKKDKDQPVHFNTVTEISTYDQLDVPAQTDNLYTVIVPSDTTGDKPVSPTVSMATVRPRVQTENTSRVNNEDDGDYNVITRQGMTPRKVDDSYSHIGRTNKGFEEDAYDVASTKQAEDRRDDTYNHTATVNENTGDTTDYYNTRSLVGDNNEGLGRQGDTPENTDVYSVAKGISNA